MTWLSYCLVLSAAAWLSYFWSFQLCIVSLISDHEINDFTLFFPAMSSKIFLFLVLSTMTCISYFQPFHKRRFWPCHLRHDSLISGLVLISGFVKYDLTLLLPALSYYFWSCQFWCDYLISGIVIYDKSIISGPVIYDLTLLFLVLSLCFVFLLSVILGFQHFPLITFNLVF